MNVNRMESLLVSFDTIFLCLEDIFTATEKDVKRWHKIIEHLKLYEKRILYELRDDTSSRCEILEKLKTLGFEVAMVDIVCQTYLLASYLKKRLNKRKVYVLGSVGLAKELSAAGLQYFGTGPDPLESTLVAFLEDFETEEREVGAVLVGFDKHLNYVKMSRVASYLTDPEVIFLATSSAHLVKPFVAFSECCSDRKALILENDKIALRETIRHSYNVDPERTLLIANQPLEDDRPQGAMRYDFKTLLLNGPRMDDDEVGWKISINFEELASDFNCTASMDALTIS